MGIPEHTFQVTVFTGIIFLTVLRLQCIWTSWPVNCLPNQAQNLDPLAEKEQAAHIGSVIQNIPTV